MTQPARPAQTHRPAGGRSGRWPARDERGSATSQMVLVLPVVLVVWFLTFQAALWFQARTLALVAAEQGARAAAADHATAADGQHAATALLDGRASPLQQPIVTVDRGPATVTVRVTGHALRLVPGWTAMVDQSAQYPVERTTR